MPKEKILTMSEKKFKIIITFPLFPRVQQLSKQIGEKLLDIAETVTKRSEVQEVRMQLGNL